MTEMDLTIYASIGNSDNKLSQQRWSEFAQAFVEFVERHASQVYGVWFSKPDAPYQNACVGFAIAPSAAVWMRDCLVHLRANYDQTSVAWAVVERTDFI